MTKSTQTINTELFQGRAVTIVTYLPESALVLAPHDDANLDSMIARLDAFMCSELQARKSRGLHLAPRNEVTAPVIDMPQIAYTPIWMRKSRTEAERITERYIAFCTPSREDMLTGCHQYD